MHTVSIFWVIYGTLSKFLISSQSRLCLACESAVLSEPFLLQVDEDA